MATGVRTLQTGQPESIPTIRRSNAIGNFIVLVLVLLVMAVIVLVIYTAGRAVFGWVQGLATTQVNGIHIATPQPISTGIPSECTAVTVECGEHNVMPAVPGIHSLIAARVAAPLRNPNVRFAKGMDSACIYAELYSKYMDKTITCEEVHAATEQMSQWIEADQ